MLPLKAKDSEGAPKNVISDYKAFEKLYKTEIREKMPESERTMVEINKKAKEAFENITKKQKEAVDKYIEEDKKRYEKERNQFNEKGYYTLADGTKSTDAEPKKSKKAKSDSDTEEKSKEKDMADSSVKKQAPKKMGRRCGG